MKNVIFLFPLAFLLACTPGNADPSAGENNAETAGDSTTITDPTAEVPTNYSVASTLPKDTTIVPPAGWTSLGMATGDLTKDGLAERVVVYDTPVATDFGTARQLYIYQQKEGHWQLWQKINGGILPSENGGMMGDPFEGITIERGTIVITHFGGSRQKWTYTHRTQPLPQLAGFEPGSNEVKLPAPEEAFYY